MDRYQSLELAVLAGLSAVFLLSPWVVSVLWILFMLQVVYPFLPAVFLGLWLARIFRRGKNGLEPRQRQSWSNVGWSFTATSLLGAYGGLFTVNLALSLISSQWLLSLAYLCTALFLFIGVVIPFLVPMCQPVRNLLSFFLRVTSYFSVLTLLWVIGLNLIMFTTGS